LSPQSHSNEQLVPKPQASPYFGALDGFRGLFAVLVAVHHTTWYSYLNYSTFINDAFVIIDLFFALSGFLMFYLYADRLHDKPSIIKFVKRRFARLYPLHFFMLLVFIGFSLLRILAHKWGVAAYEPGEILPFSSGARDGWPSLLSNLTLTHSMGIHDELSFNFPSWTVSVEFFTYLVFIVIIVLKRPQKMWHYGVLSLGILSIYAALSRVKPNMDITYDLGFFRCLAGFLTGGIAAWVYGYISSRLEALKKTGVSLSPAIFTMIEVITLAVSFIFVTYFTQGKQFYVGPVLFLFICVFAFDEGAISWFMSRPIFRYLAKISYSVYMTHVIFAIVFNIFAERLLPGMIPGPDVFAGGINGDLYLIPYIVVVIIFSHFTWRFVEKPGGAFLRNLSFGTKTKNC